MVERRSRPAGRSELAVSENTVEYHLKNIYAKLGIRARSELIVRLATETAHADRIRTP